MSAVDAARRLARSRPSHPVVSLYLDLDPEQFATAPARASQIRSLLDGASRDVEGDGGLGHDDLVALREDLERVRRFLLSREPPFKGARALAIFCSGRDELFEVLQVSHPVTAQVVIERTPYVEPLVQAGGEQRWCVVLVNRRDARVLSGLPDQLEERDRVADDVHGQHDQGGFSQARYQRSVEEDADSHLRSVAERVHRRWRQERFHRLAIGGPQEVVARFESMLHEELRARLVRRRIELDISSANENQVRSAVGELVEECERERERDALDRLAAGLGRGGRAAGGPEATLEALGERRVEALLVENGFARSGGRCPACGLLRLESSGKCPVDGTPLEEVERLVEAAVEAALTQDAEVIVVRRHPDLGPHQGMAALLRY